MIVSLSTHKGGTGKTTSSINLATCLAQRGDATLLIDMDPQGHAAPGIGVEVSYNDKSVADVLGDTPLPLSEVIRETPIPNLMFAPSNLRLAAAFENVKYFREQRLQRSLEPLASQYRWVLIDCPPALGFHTANALFASDVVLMPCQMGARALDGLQDLLNLIAVLKGNTFDTWHIFPTMIDTRNKVTLDVFMRELKPYEECGKVLETTIYRNEALNQAQIAKKPIFSFDPASRGAENYTQLTEELRGLYRQDI